jgi:hypothetical protein
MSLTLDGTNGISASGGVNVLQNNSVVTGNLVDSAVTTAKIANDAVTTAKIGNSQVTDAKVAGIAASKITSGTVAVARLGSGTPGTGNFLRGDGSWQTVPASAPSTTDVLNATAGASAGAVGTYAFLADITNNATTINQGATIAGSSLKFSCSAFDGAGNWFIDTANGQTPSGTWRLMGLGRRDVGSGVQRYGSLFLRIS